MAGTSPSTVDNTTTGLERAWHPVGPAGTTPPWPLLGRTIDDAADCVDRFGLRWVAPAPPCAGLPAVPDDADPSMTRLVVPAQVWRAGAAQMADNFADIGHLPFVHATSFADPDDVVVPRLDVAVGDFDYTIGYEHRTRRLHTDGVGRRRMTIDVFAPFTVVLRLDYLDDDAVITTLFAHQPIDVDRTALHVVLWRDDVADGRAGANDAVDFQQAVAEEDRRVVESLDTNHMPLDPTAEVHTLADRPTLELRRLLSRFLAADD